jgi:hypothetical protein
MADLDENELEWRGADTHKYCYECRYDGNCPNDKPYCIRAYCVECKNDEDCPDDKSCEVGGFCKKLLKDIK